MLSFVIPTLSFAFALISSALAFRCIALLSTPLYLNRCGSTRGYLINMDLQYARLLKQAAMIRIFMGIDLAN